MTPDPKSSAPLAPVPMAAPMAPHGHQIQARHLTELPPEGEEAEVELARALRNGSDNEELVALLKRVCQRYPTYLDGWARLGQATYRSGEFVTAYAFARVGYHRGLDRLRQNGWGGTGQVRWSTPSNRGFLRSLHLLMVTSDAIGEGLEAERCRQFLLDLDPEDGLGISQMAPLGRGEPLPAETLP